MNVRFQADADINPEIVRALRRREPAIDFRAAAGVIVDGVPDLDVLAMAASDNRVLVTRDVTTMPAHFKAFVSQHHSPGMLLIPSSRSIGTAIEGLLIVWLSWLPEELSNQIRWLP